MNKYINFFVTIFLFFIVPIILNSLLSSLNSNNIIELILRLGINSLILLTIIYLFYFDLAKDWKNLINNKANTFKSVILYLLILVIIFIIIFIITFLINQCNGSTILKIDLLYKRIPYYLFINNILLLPLMETIVLRHMLFKIVKKNNLLYIIGSIILILGYYLLILNLNDSSLLVTGFVLSIFYLQKKNIITITIISMLFNFLYFLFNYL